MSTPTEHNHQKITLRRIEPNDEEFLLRVYASTRLDEMALVPWDEAQKQAFLTMQFTAQDHYYREKYPKAQYSVILVNGQPVGRLYLDRNSQEIRIIDLTVLPEYGDPELETALLNDLQTEATATEKPLHIYLESFNPALRFFEGMGFFKIGEHGIYLLLEWSPPRENKSLTV